MRLLEWLLLTFITWCRAAPLTRKDLQAANNARLDIRADYIQATASTSSSAPLTSTNAHNLETATLAPTLSGSTTTTTGYISTSTASQTVSAMPESPTSLTQATALLYNFTPTYNLFDKATYDTTYIFTLDAWKERQMDSWSRMYIDSFYDKDLMDSDGTNADFIEQFLTQPEVSWNPQYCDLNSGQAGCAVAGAYERLKLQSNGQLTNHEVNALLLFYSIGNWNQAYYALYSGVSLSRLGSDGNGINRWINALLPPEDPKKDDSMWLSIVDIALTVLPELGLAEMVGAAIANKALAKAVKEGEELEQSAMKTLQSQFDKLEQTSSAFKTQKPSRFLQAAEQAAIDDFGNLIEAVSKKVSAEKDVIAKSKDEWNKIMKKIMSGGKSAKTVISGAQKFVASIAHRTDGARQLKPSELQYWTNQWFEDYRVDLKTLYNQNRFGHPYQTGGIFDMVHDGSFVNPTSDSEISKIQDQFDKYIRDWLFMQVMGETGARMVIYKQQFADEAACNKAMQAINDVPGKICLPPNTALPYQSTLNEHGSGYYYLFYPVAMVRIGTPTRRLDDGTLVPAGPWQLPYTVDGSGHFGSSNFQDFASPYKATFVPGMKDLDQLYDPATFYWNAWKWSQSWAMKDNGKQFWKVPDPGTAQDVPPSTIPVMDVNDSVFVNFVETWSNWNLFSGYWGGIKGYPDQARMWFVFLATVMAQDGVDTMDAYSKGCQQFWSESYADAAGLPADYGPSIQKRAIA